MTRRPMPFSYLNRFVSSLAQTCSGLSLQQQPLPMFDAQSFVGGPLPAPRSFQTAEHNLQIPVCDRSPEDDARRSMHDYGQFFARQDRWEDLVEALHVADEERHKTPGGMPVADLIAYGARADIVQAAEHALLDGEPEQDIPLRDGVGALEDVRLEIGEAPMMTCLLAQTHVDLAWAWRGQQNDNVLPRRNREAFAAHMDRATELVDSLPDALSDSPFATATRASVLVAQDESSRSLADKYENLIDLDMHDQRQMRVLGHYLLPKWFGSYADLELEARRTAARTQGIWGAGGYTWVQFDAIAQDPGACRALDVPFFIEGLRDIADKRPDQSMINMLTSYCAITIRNGFGECEEADFVRTQIVDCANWLIKQYLTEVHPMIWAHAAEGFDNSAKVSSLSRFAARGRADALRTIAEQFADDFARGLRVTFTEDGPQLHPA